MAAPDSFGPTFGGYVNVSGPDVGEVTAVQGELDKFIALIPSFPQISPGPIAQSPAVPESSKSHRPPDLEEMSPQLAEQLLLELAYLRAAWGDALPTVTPVPAIPPVDPTPDSFGPTFGGYANVAGLDVGEVADLRAELDKFVALIPDFPAISPGPIAQSPAVPESSESHRPPDLEQMHPQLAAQLLLELAQLNLAIGDEIP